MLRRLGSRILLLAAFSAGAARAQPSQAGPAGVRPYPLNVRLTLTPATLRARFSHPTPGAISLPPNPGSTVFVGEQAREAYAASLPRMFRGGPGEALEVEVSVASADLDFDADGWHALVLHTVVLRDAAGEELGRWAAKGREPISGPGDKAIPRAFARAAATAARSFELAFEEPPAVSAWLRARGLEVGAWVRVPDPPPPPLIQPVTGPPRGDLVLFVDAGLGVIPFTARRYPYYKSDILAGGFDARAGLSSRRVMLQLAGSRWASNVESGDTRDRFTVTTIGLDAGPLLRFSGFELGAGLGAHRIMASCDVSPMYSGASQWRDEQSRDAVSLFGTLRSAWSAGKVHIRFTIEVRRFLGAPMEFAGESRWGSREDRRLELDNVFAILLGFEVPTRRAATR